MKSLIGASKSFKIIFCHCNQNFLRLERYFQVASHKANKFRIAGLGNCSDLDSQY